MFYAKRAVDRSGQPIDHASSSGRAIRIVARGRGDEALVSTRASLSHDFRHRGLHDVPFCISQDFEPVVSFFSRGIGSDKPGEIIRIQVGEFEFVHIDTERVQGLIADVFLEKGKLKSI